ncbi:hypothetical protein Fmac_011783 [Flemingia macrophylla]|uniref:Uncharacterized protein n=1 Tax=Flemingia macrophylla TaxID=520843 RepID=A0ABD1MPA0_9FABA
MNTFFHEFMENCAVDEDVGVDAEWFTPNFLNEIRDSMNSKSLAGPSKGTFSYAPKKY